MIQFNRLTYVENINSTLRDLNFSQIYLSANKIKLYAAVLKFLFLVTIAATLFLL